MYVFNGCQSRMEHMPPDCQICKQDAKNPISIFFTALSQFSPIIQSKHTRRVWGISRYAATSAEYPKRQIPPRIMHYYKSAKAQRSTPPQQSGFRYKYKPHIVRDRLSDIFNKNSIKPPSSMRTMCRQPFPTTLHFTICRQGRHQANNTENKTNNSMQVIRFAIKPKYERNTMSIN